jgi:hypothetical protein
MYKSSPLKVCTRTLWMSSATFLAASALLWRMGAPASTLISLRSRTGMKCSGVVLNLLSKRYRPNSSSEKYSRCHLSNRKLLRKSRLLRMRFRGPLPRTATRPQEHLPAAREGRWVGLDWIRLD